MAVRAPKQPVRGLAYKRILVPLVDEDEAEHALTVACRLAAEHGAHITALVVIELPAELPLDAHMLEEEARAKTLLEKAHAIGGRYGVALAGHTLRAREAGRVIVDEAERADAEAVLIGARRRRFGFGRTVRYVLKHAECRVLLLASAPE